MKTLVDRVTWKMHEHAVESRGMIKLGGGRPNKLLDTLRELSKKDDIGEEFCVMTRKPLLGKPRTSVFVPGLQAEGGILFWKTREEGELSKLHQVVVQIASEIGLTEFKTMTEAHGPSAPLYWREMLGENFHRVAGWM